MGKAINALVSAADETSESVQGTRLVFLDFNEKTGAREKFVTNKNKRTPHERVVTEIREVKYLRDGFIKEEGDLKPRKIVLETYGTEVVKEVLVPVSSALASTYMVKVVGQVVRDLRRKEEF